jgi:RNA polymerase sigma-70 factor (ECF subfamily)
VIPRLYSPAVPDSSGEELANLVAGIVARDPRAEADLVERYSRAVAMLIRRLIRDEAERDDLFQETFRIAIGRVRQGAVREPERLSGFVCQIARNVALEHCRRAARRDDLVGGHPAQEPAASPFEQLERKQNAELVRRVMAQLPSERHRELLERYYIHQESKERICADLELAPLQFDQIHFRARERYRGLYLKAVGRKGPA